MSASWRTSGRTPASIRRVDGWGVMLLVVGLASITAAVFIAWSVDNGRLALAMIPGLFAVESGVRHLFKWEAPRGV
jgi:hypothetical protein